MSTASKSRSPRTVLQPLAAALLLAGAASPAMALNVTLCAEPYTQSLPGPRTVLMWGYRLAANAAACAGNVGVGTASPGPVITVPASDTTLVVTLVNNLTVPTSLVLAGQALPSDGGPPVLAADVIGPACVPDRNAAPADAAHPQNCRLRSFTGETDAGASRTYTFLNLKPGSYLYQSGTHQQVQVQMGLFGLARHDALVSGNTSRLLFADPAAAYDVDVPLVLSEIDPEQHDRIAGTLGSANPASWKAGSNSTLNYAPKYFLVNGKVFTGLAGDGSAATDLPVQNAPTGSRVVLRIANAGLQSRSLMLNSGTWKLLTEDGYPYPSPREQATALVPAGKTTDAALAATTNPDNSINRSIALFDRRGGTDNGDGSALGGQVARLAQSGPAVPYLPAIGNQVANEGSIFTFPVAGVNITAYSLSSVPSTSAPAINASSGLITWSPVPTGTPAGTSYSLTVNGTDGAITASRNFGVRINHAPTLPAIAAIPVAHGSVSRPAGTLMAGAADIDGDALVSVLKTGTASGTLSANADGSFSWTGPQPATGTTAVTFTVAARDPYTLESAPRTVTLNVAANVPPVAANDAYSVTLSRLLGAIRLMADPAQVAALTAPVTQLTGNDSDPDGGTLNLTTIAAVVPVPPLTTGTVSARRINPASPTGCTTNCVTLNPSGLQSQASVTFNANGTFVLRPHVTLGGLGTPVPGTYEFRYTVKDEQGGTSNQAVVRATVQ